MSEQKPDGPRRVIKPVVAVTDFDNRSNFHGQWNLGGGMADLLAAKLLESGRFVVLERRHLDNVVGEIVRQGADLFRREGRVDRGRLKNAKFLLRGVVTDFTVTRDSSGWFGASNLRAGIGGQRARVALNVQLVDVESGEILHSVQSSETVSSGWLSGAANYKEYNFGADSFYRTPLGKATEGAIEDAVDEIVDKMPVQYWRPTVAEVSGDMVVINGGDNVGLKAGMEFVVRGESRRITDPLTGDTIGIVPGPIMGRLAVTEVLEAASHARLLQGRAQRGWPMEASARP